MLKLDLKLGYINKKCSHNSGSHIEYLKTCKRSIYTSLAHFSQFFFSSDKRLWVLSIFFSFCSVVYYICMNEVLWQCIFSRFITQYFFLLYIFHTFYASEVSIWRRKKIHYNNWTIVLYFRLYFSVVAAIAVTTMVFSDYFFMWIHIGTTEHNRDQCGLKCLYGMKKRQRWTVVFRISFELRRLANDFNETAKKRFHEMNFEAISFG